MEGTEKKKWRYKKGKWHKKKLEATWNPEKRTKKCKKDSIVIVPGFRANNTCTVTIM